MRFRNIAGVIELEASDLAKLAAGEELTAHIGSNNATAVILRQTQMATSAAPVAQAPRPVTVTARLSDGKPVLTPYTPSDA